MELPGEAEIECAICTSTLYVSGLDISVESESSDDRSMGKEVFYSGSSDFMCPNCENNIEVTYEATEYPEGALNYSDTHVSGGKLTSGFGDIELVFEEELYSFDEQSRLYLPEEKEIITNLNNSTFDLIYAISKNPKILYSLDSRKFEELLAHIFSKHGFIVKEDPFCS